MLKEWVESIVVFTILFSCVLYLVPHEKYKKYIQTAIGFIMMIIIIHPLLSLGDIKTGLEFDDYYEIGSVLVSGNDKNYYCGVLESVIEEHILSQTGVSCELQIELDEAGAIKRVSVKTENNRQETVKKILTKEYGVSEELIFFV